MRYLSQNFVHLSAKRVHCDKTKEPIASIDIPVPHAKSLPLSLVLEMFCIQILGFVVHFLHMDQRLSLKNPDPPKPFTESILAV